MEARETLTFALLVASASLLGACGEDGAATGTGGNGPGGGAAGAGACAPPSPPGSASCPAACTGGCEEGNVCVVDCEGEKTCDGATLTCPPDYACRVLCNGIDSCDVGTIECPTKYACSVVCDGGADACGDLQVHCADGPCDIECKVTGACVGTLVRCGSGACSATCGADPKPTMNDCQNACSCTECTETDAG